ncbi:MAG: DHHA1 domain-containing protein [Gammaproteobacteria bacterium]|nr:DHHA1 domain-containing protein [Gammaproteobacteria bacterium]
MKFIDVFNGDADGICALHQLRLCKPLVSTLVTGVKRDITLLKKVEAARDDTITVLDISLERNREALLAFLDKGTNVVYFDHHFAGEIPDDDRLEAYINMDANICTSLLVNQYLNNKHLAWAVTGAFGDNLFVAAEQAAKPLDLSAEELEQLKLLGTCLNYNGYGASIDDLIFPPQDLYNKIKPYANPFDFINYEPAYQLLVNGYHEDMANAAASERVYETAHHAVVILENEKWARRVSGVFANQLAQENPDRAHAMLTRNENGGFVVSVRAPLSNKTGADELCRQFHSGGGRKAAAGINHLPEAEYDQFMATFLSAFID